MTKTIHVHKYGLFKIGLKRQYEVMKCNLPLCTHYLEARLAIGKMSICWRCGEDFVLGIDDLKLKPACYDCLQANKPNGGPGSKDAIDTIMDSLDLDSVEE